MILFWLSLLGIVHTYLIFPTLIIFFGKIKKQNVVCFSLTELPLISIIIAAHNEEKVIEKKIESTLKSNVNTENFEILIGSDCSTDNTNQIISEFIKKHDNIHFFEFNERQGKASIINQLVEKAKGEILICTDANVFFTSSTIYELVKHFKNPKIGQVGGNIINTNLKSKGISVPEKKYLDIEKQIKFSEGKLWGTMLGAFGGCYAIQKKLYKNVPKGYLMDDFYVSMEVLASNYKAIFEPLALCYEDVSDKISEEFRRKVRISAGNFQNLFAYKHLLFKPNFGLVFSFISHKILRWKTPILMVLIFMLSYKIGINHQLYKQLFYFQALLLLPLCFDFILRQFNIHFKPFRFVTHFLTMNLALLLGLFKFIFGVKSNVWKPTERNQ